MEYHDLTYLIVKGLEESYLKLLDEKIKNREKLIVSENGKIKRLDPKKIKKQLVKNE